MVMYANMRGRLPGVTKDLATNAERGIYFPRRQAQSAPEYIRAVLMKKHCAWSSSDEMAKYDTAFVASDFSIITNWSQLVTFVTPKGVKLLAHAPASAFVKALPVDSCVIFKADELGTIALNHNFRTETATFQDSLRKSMLFQQVVYPSKPTLAEISRSHKHWNHVKQWIITLRAINNWRAQAWGTPVGVDPFER